MSKTHTLLVPVGSASQELTSKPIKQRVFIGFILVFIITMALVLTLIGGSESEVAFTVHLLKTPDIYCNDGTTPGFYFKPSTVGSDKWVIHLPGGFFCYSNESCYERSVELPEFMTGPTEGASKEGEGILSTSDEDNPLFYSANIVELTYCSSDCYFGDKEYNESAQLYTSNLYFHGGKMVRALFSELISDYGMLEASSVYVSGESVGGIALLGRFDEMCEQLVTEIGSHVEVMGISSAGWYLYDRVYEDFDIPPTVVIKELIGFANAAEYGDSDCIASDMDDLLCYFGSYLSAYIQSSGDLYVIQNMFDNSHAAAEGYNDLLTEPADKITDPFPFEGAAMYFEQVPANASAYFVPDCRCHDLISTNDWSVIQIDGISLADSVSAFALHRYDDAYEDEWQLSNSDPSCLECNAVCSQLECWQP